uniref:DUF5672 domain-containing protein n=1 Tax=viral metagenome TaxID=1070528 RepID=A0A6C0B0Z0_9ZZZZ
MNFTYTAIIIEPRKHKAIEFVLNNVCECLSHEWNVILFHGNKNYDYANTIVKKLNSVHNERISMVNLNIDNLTTEEYNHLFVTKSILYENILSETFIVFQTDSMIFKRNSHLLNEYLEYDYVGAPWPIDDRENEKLCGYIGNGGFSLRKKSKMLEIIEKKEFSLQMNEDVYFNIPYDDIHMKRPSYEKASLFSVEGVFRENAFACHKPCLFFLNAFRFHYPEFIILESLQSCEE